MIFHFMLIVDISRRGTLKILIYNFWCINLPFLVNCPFVLMNNTCVVISKIGFTIFLDFVSYLKLYDWCLVIHLPPLCMLHFCYSLDVDNMGFNYSDGEGD